METEFKKIGKVKLLKLWDSNKQYSNILQTEFHCLFFELF